jgi:Flp pilus assembly protein TadD
VRTKLLIGLLATALVTCLGPLAKAGDLRINIPRRSRLTPVQRLNRDGVEAVRKHQYQKAKELFYEAYLYDPGDPFTLNNIGYIAELEGDAERAHKFYSMATGQATDALIDRASSAKLEGKSLQTAINSIRDVPMQINRANVNAVRLLSEGRIREADDLLQRTLTLDPNNPFTLNNVGVAKEAQGEYNEALRYYKAAADTHVEEPVVVTMAANWRGKPVSEMAEASAARLRSRMKTMENERVQVALLNLRGVSALNRNDVDEAWKNFSKAYKLDPYNAFSLNNQGYIAEIYGDLESAQEFYRAARAGEGAMDRVGLATRPAAEGTKLSDVAEDSEGHVDNAIEAAQNARRRSHAPIQLKRRDGKPINETTPPPQNPAQRLPTTQVPPQ